MSDRVRLGSLAPAALVLGAAAAALAPGGPDALAPFRAAAAAAEVSVAVVIDFGGGSGAPSTVVQCVQVPSGSTDADALSAVASQQVAYAQSGLLCQIDGYPAGGVSTCNAVSGQEYYFWSYWHGSSGSWIYANNGPGSQPVAPGDVEGWRYQDPGPANPSAPAPGPAPDYASICPDASAASTTTTTVAPPSAGPGPVSGAAATAATTPAPVAAPGGAGVTTTVAKAAPPSAPSARGAPPTPVTTAAGTPGAGATTTTSVPRRATTKGTHTVTVRPGDLTRRALAVGTPADERRPAGGGALLPAVVVGVLALALALVAALRWKKRTESS